MLAFIGMFTTNAVLPDYAGIGKSVARGFGTILKME
ncbi:MAG: CRISPR-associated endonuclease Cas6 [Chlorobi bacterium]|nr:CRISPR-associated endonuclease Cas6 [Chlorobiota bacterium]